jgi:hypothetical protein
MYIHFETSDARHIREIKSRTATAKTAFNKKKLFSLANWTSIEGRN